MADMVTYPLNKIEYQATDAELFHSTRTSGVFTDGDFNMSVTGTNNIVTIAQGIAWIKNGQFSGKVCANKTAKNVDLGVANASLPRWDVVCIQFDKNKNATDIVAKTGVAASSPVMPAISQTETLYELYLCKVYRPAGSATITAGNVYDLRLDETVCGLMADSVTKIDTSAIKKQVDALVEFLKEEIQNTSDGSAYMQKSVYDTDNDGIVDKAENATTADTLKTARKIGNASFNGSKNVTLAEMGALSSEGGEITGSLVGKGNVDFIKIKNSNGVPLKVMHLNGNNHLVIGSGLFEEKNGDTYLYAGKDIYLTTKGTGDATYGLKVQEVTNSAAKYAFMPSGAASAQMYLGTANSKFYQVYAEQGTIQTSDGREKENIIPLGTSLVMPLSLDENIVDIHSELFDRLQPVQFNFINGDGRMCFGLIAQDVVTAMEELGIGENELDLLHHDYWTDDKTGEEKELYGLSYNNLIALLIYEVQKLKAKIKQMEAEE